MIVTTGQGEARNVPPGEVIDKFLGESGASQELIPLINDEHNRFEEEYPTAANLINIIRALDSGDEVPEEDPRLKFVNWFSGNDRWSQLEKTPLNVIKDSNGDEVLLFEPKVGGTGEPASMVRIDKNGIKLLTVSSKSEEGERYGGAYKVYALTALSKSTNIQVDKAFKESGFVLKDQNVESEAVFEQVRESMNLAVESQEKEEKLNMERAKRERALEMSKLYEEVQVPKEIAALEAAFRKDDNRDKPKIVIPPVAPSDPIRYPVRA